MTPTGYPLAMLSGKLLEFEQEKKREDLRRRVPDPLRPCTGALV
jgi:hypothetical protein